MKNSINLIKQERKLPFSPDWGLLGPALRYTFFFFFCFVEVSALLDVRYHPNEQFDAISRKTNDTNLIKLGKPKFRPNFGQPTYFF